MSYQPSDNMIEISDAARAYGVSRSTIDCFIETGYLQIEREGTGSKFLNKKSLAAVFGTPLHSDQEKVIEEQNPVEDAPLGAKLASEILVETATLPVENIPPEGKLAASLEIESTEADQALSAELMKFKNIASVQEQILKVRDEQIKELKEEREWLRERLERMEQSAQRDQLLLLASNETLRSIVHTKNRSPIRLALEWFGFVEPNQGVQQPINVTDSANKSSAGS